MLRKKIEEIGVVEPPVWNERSGNLVGGHQRISILDDLNGSDSYTIAVAVVRLTDKQERELNVFLNNSAAQGTFTEALLTLIRAGDVSLDGIGMTAADLEQEFGKVELPELTAKEDPQPQLADPPKKQKAPALSSADAPPPTSAPEAKQDEDNVVLLCFQSQEEKAEWLKSRGIPEDMRVLPARQVFGEIE